jgi:hypothetical protein
MTQATRYLDRLSRAGRGTALEGTGNDRGHVPDKRDLLDRLEAEIAYLRRKTGITPDPAQVDTLVSQADQGLRRLLGDGADARLGPAEISGLEAVIRTDGSRPVLFVDDDFIDVTEPAAADYAAGLSRMEDAVRHVCRSVGRVDDPDPAVSIGYHGTAWMLAEGLVATNFHVLAEIAPGGERRDRRFEGRLKPGVAVHFGREVGSRRPERRFPIRRVVSVGCAGAAEFGWDNGLNFDGLDLAILELEPVAGRSFPPPNRVARGDDAATHGGLACAGRGIYLVGYPGNERSTRPDLFVSLFASAKGFKRLAPGRIMAGPGEVPGDPRGWIMTHDASTLGGNSGSALADYDADGRVLIGLHFAGQPDMQNWAYSLERITPELAPVLPRAAS